MSNRWPEVEAEAEEKAEERKRLQVEGQVAPTLKRTENDLSFMSQ